jgi:membrane-associated phospholipid phosphatase
VGLKLPVAEPERSKSVRPWFGLLSLFSPVLPILLFVLITFLVAAGAFHRLDSWTAALAQTVWSTPIAVSWAVLYVAGSALVSALLLMVVLAFLQLRDSRLAVGLLLAFLVGNAIELALKHSLAQLSPPLVQGIIPVPLPEDAFRTFVLARLGMLDAARGDTVYSYPSGHMLRSLLVLVAVAAAWPRPSVRWVTIVASFAAAFILVGARVHWLSDVLGGALLAWALASAAIYWALDRGEVSGTEPP